MNTLDSVIAASTFEQIPGLYCYAQLEELPQGIFFMVTKDASEISVVCTEEQLTDLKPHAVYESRYVLIAINVSIPFTTVGFLAAVTECVAARGCNVLVVSTYSKDYILIRQEQWEIAKEALIQRGLKEK